MKASWTRLMLYLQIFILPNAGESLKLATCRTMLGMQNGVIPDSALSASSSKENDLGPQRARIRSLKNEKNGNAWCPKEEVSKDSFEYLQIDLGELKVITMIETQGRFGNGQGQEYTEQYLVNYQREDGGSWFRYRNNRGQELFQGNSNPYSTELRDVIPAIIAKRIRVIPYSTHPKHVCLGIELYGCTWTDGSVSYDMHQGERRGTDIDLYDYAYDGIVLRNYLSGGLGQLTDGDEGQSNFRLDPRNLGKRGYEWIGWKSDTFGTDPVEITFKFDDVRNFSLLQIYGNNLFTKDVRIFQSAKVFFSVDGQFAAAPPVEFVYRRDSQSEAARAVNVSLQQRVGRYVKVWLFFDAKWMLISEVHFESERVNSNSNSNSSSSSLEDEPLGSAATSNSNSNSINRTKNVSTVPLHVTDDDDDRKSMISAASGGSSDASGSRPGSAADAFDPDPDAELDIADGFLVTSMTDRVETADRRRLNDKYIGIIIAVLSGLTLALLAVLILVFIRHRKYTCMPLPYPLPKVTKPVVTSYSPSPPDTLNKSSLPRPGASYPPIHEPIYDNIPSRGGDRWTVAVTCATSGSSSSSSESTAAVTAETLSRLFVRDFNGVCKSSSPEGGDTFVPPLMVSPDQVAAVERLGESAFGEVHLSNVHVEPTYEESLGTLSTLRQSRRTVLAIVRWLKCSADDRTRAEFSREVKKMLLLKHLNVAQVIGLCTSSSDGAFGSTGVLLEAGEFGDLKTFLQQHVAESGATMRRDAKVLSYGTLVYIATQIASGMKHMEVLNVTHCDLASRNCLVGSQFVVKVADLGRSYSRHRMDYCSLQGYAGLPIRWMAWEAVVLGKFSTKSDIWSFAVTVWEILTLARRWPLDSLSDKQVVENCNHCYVADGLELCLDQPALCTREVYDLLLECCHRNELQRPSFREIHMFLQRKNMGYRPDGGGGDRTETS